MLLLMTVRSAFSLDKVNLDSNNSGGWTPLSWAARRGYGAVVKLLLEEGADMDSKKETTSRTPISWAAENAREVVERPLLKKEAQADS